MAGKGVVLGSAVVLGVAMTVALPAQADFVFVDEPPKPVVKPAEEVPTPVATQPVVAPTAAPVPVAAEAPRPLASPAQAQALEVDRFEAAPQPSTVIPTVPTHASLFDVKAGETVRTALERWSAESGWKLIWQADFDLRIEADNVFMESDITEAVPAVLKAFPTPPGRPRLSMAAYRGNRVIVIAGKL